MEVTKCNSCREDISEGYQLYEHSCLSNEYLGCVDGKDCPEYVEDCDCKCNKLNTIPVILRTRSN